MMKKFSLLFVLFIVAMSCNKDEIANPDQVSVIEESIKKENSFSKSPITSYTLNTLNPIYTGATYGVKRSSGDLQIATQNAYSHDITFLFKWYRINGGTRNQIIPVVYSMTLPANSTFVEKDMSNSDYLLNQECTGNETINAQYEVEIYNAFSIGTDFSFENITISNNNLSYSVEYRCGQFGGGDFN